MFESINTLFTGSVLNRQAVLLHLQHVISTTLVRGQTRQGIAARTTPPATGSPADL